VPGLPFCHRPDNQPPTSGELPVVEANVISLRSARLSRKVVTLVVTIVGVLWVTLLARADQFHSVRKGETLTQLARRYKISVAELAKRNGLSTTAQLHIGQGLVIPGPREVPALPESVRQQMADTRPTPGKWKYIVVHHSGTYMATVKGMDRFHRQERHMTNGLAYHFVIGNGNGMEDGEIAVGHRWKEQLDGGHLRSDELNAVSIGICLVGDFEHAHPTPKQMDSLRALIHDLLARCKLGADCIRTHQQINPVYTRCPGRDFPTEAFLAEFKDGR
jgi:LysM repeat protein